MSIFQFFTLNTLKPYKLQFTTDFAAPPGLHARDASNRTETPNGGTTPRASTPPPLANQRTGEWSYGFPNFRQSLLGGKSLNRFSSFVTTGAEEFVLNGTTTGDSPTPQPASFHAKEDSVEDEGDGERVREATVKEADRHFVEAGPAWKPKLPEFKILVHSPSKRSSTLGAFTIYNVTSIFTPDRANHDSMSNDSEEDDPSPTTITVHRRFSHFVFLHTALTKRLPGIVLPPLPEKQYAGRFSDEFVEARRGDLERYMNRIVRHPVARYAEVVTFFLSCESEMVSR
jgi:sorting nexin-9/18/33